MENYFVQINEKQLILLILKYLNSRNFLKSYITLETETKTSLESLGEELTMLRQLILEGQFEESEVYLTPFLEKYGSSIHPAIFEIKKQYYLELLEIGPDYQIMTKLLKQLQSYSTKEQYKGLFYLLSLETITEHSEYKHWTAERGRIDCFEKVKDIINEVYPLEQYKQVDVGNTLQNALERLLYLEIQNDRIKKDKLKGIVIAQQQQQQQQVQQQRGMYVNECNWIENECGISILDDSLIGGQSSKRVKIEFKSSDNNKQITDSNTIITEDTKSCKFKPSSQKASPGSSSSNNNIAQPTAVSAYVTKQTKNTTHTGNTGITSAQQQVFPSQLSQSHHQASQLLQSDLLDSQHGISEMDNLDQDESVIEESQETELLELYQNRLHNHYNQLQNKSVLKAQRLLASNNNPSFIPFAAQSEINQNQHYYDSNYYSQSTPGLFVQGNNAKNNNMTNNNSSYASQNNNNNNNNVSSTHSRQSQQHNSNSRVSQINNKDSQDNHINNNSSIKHGNQSQQHNSNNNNSRSSNTNNKKDAQEMTEEYVHSRRFYAQTPSSTTKETTAGIGRSVNNNSNKITQSNNEIKDKNTNNSNALLSNNNSNGLYPQGKQIDNNDDQVKQNEFDDHHDDEDGDQQNEDGEDYENDDVNGSADTVLQIDKQEGQNEEEEDEENGDNQQQSVDDKSHYNDSRISQKQLDKAPHEDFQQFSYHKEFFNSTTSNNQLPSGSKANSNNSSSYSRNKNAQSQQKQVSQQVTGSQQLQEVFEIDYSELVEVCQIKDIQPIRTAQFSPDGEYFAVGTNSKALKTFALKDVIRGFRNNNSANTTTQPLWERLNHHGGSIYTLDWSRDAALIATGSIDQTIKIIKVPNPSQDHITDVLTPSQLCTTLNGHKGIVRTIKFHPDSRTLYSAGMPELNIMSWDITKAQIINTLQGHTDSINSIDIDGEGNSLVSVAKDKTLRIWDLKNGVQAGCIDLSASKYDQLNYVNLNNGFSNRNLKQLLQKSRKQLKSASNENTACVAHTNGLVSVWDLRKTTSSLQEIKMHSADCRSAEFDPTGNYIISTSFDKTICIYDINMKRILSKLTNHTDRVVLAKFHPFLPFILSTSADFTSRIFAPRDSIQTYQC